jgi:glycosyltransferase involved in cell wall biosynthesis
MEFRERRNGGERYLGGDRSVNEAQKPAGAARTLPLVTVVTPVYNGGETLAECIESVLAQSYTHFEYIIVNNCSTDRTREIAAAYAGRDARIRFVENEKFVGAQENHDAGFRRMSPESRYCKVVHADDWIFPECLERMVALAEEHPSVGIVGAYALREKWLFCDGLPARQPVFPGREVCRLTLLRRLYVFGTPTSILFRAEIVRHRDPFYDGKRFPSNCDAAACYEILRDWNFGFVTQVLTFTRKGERGIAAEAARMGRSRPEKIRMLRQYGPDYLSREEFEAQLENEVRDYYRFLATSIFSHRGKEFWMHQRAALRELGLSSSWPRLYAAAVESAMHSLSHPFRTWTTVSRKDPDRVR